MSRLYLWWPGCTGDLDHFSVVGAHRDAVLLQMAYPIPVPKSEYPYHMYDYFVYRTGGGSPSMVRLPSIDGTMEEFRALFENGSFRHSNQRLRRTAGLDIAVLRRGAEDVAVAELQIVRTPEPELHVIFPSKSAPSQWVVKKPRIIHGPDLYLEGLLCSWFADEVVPFGSYLCWVDYCQGAILLCKVFDDDPELHYLALPAKLPGLDHPNCPSGASKYITQDMDEERGVMKCVRVIHGDDTTFRQGSDPHSDFVATSWVLEMKGSHELVWNQDAELKSDRFWQLHSDEQLPHTHLEYPLVDLKDTNIIFCVMRQKGARVDDVGYDYDDMWLVSFDMSSLTVKAFFQYIKGQEDLSDEESMFAKEKSWYFKSFIPAEFPKFLKMHGTM